MIPGAEQWFAGRKENPVGTDPASADVPRSLSVPTSPRWRCRGAGRWFVLIVLGAAIPAFGQSVPFVVPAAADLYSADRPVADRRCVPSIPSMGTETVVIPLPRGVQRRAVFVDVAGEFRAGAAPTWPLGGPDGTPTIAACASGSATSLGARNGLSGIIHSSRIGFLAGAFIAATPQPGGEPPTLTFSDDAFTTLSPLLRQIFYIGDGRSAANQLQEFAVPDAATRLVVGVPDGCCFHGEPGAYGDNAGEFRGTVSFTGCLLILADPRPATVCGGSVSFTVSAAVGTFPVSYQWRRNAAAIDPASNPSAATSTLVLASVGPADAAAYDCVVTNSCGSVTSNPATLTVCRTDFNCDGAVNADDLGDFITCYFTEPPCSGADFNADGEVNADDLGDFITAYFGPAC